MKIEKEKIYIYIYEIITIQKKLLNHLINCVEKLEVFSINKKT